MWAVRSDQSRTGLLLLSCFFGVEQLSVDRLVDRDSGCILEANSVDGRK